jgi:hypothetical protein
MRYLWLPCLLALAFTTTFVSKAPAPGGLPPSIQDEVATVRQYIGWAECVVYGKVKSIEDKSIIAPTSKTGITATSTRWR